MKWPISVPNIIDLEHVGLRDYSRSFLEKNVLIELIVWLQSWTKVVETLPEKPVFVEGVSSYISDFHISTPSPLFNVVTT